MPHHQFPSNYIYWENIEKHNHIKSKYMPILDKIESTNTLENPYSLCTIKNISISNRSVNTFLDNEDINEIVWKPMDNFINEINSKYTHKISVNKSILYQYWFNTYDKHDFQEYHNHIDNIGKYSNAGLYPTLSGIYILNDDNEKSSIVFKTAYNEFKPFIKPFESVTLDTSRIEDIHEGTVLLFPSSMEHMVKKCVIPGRRTIAFNIWSEL